LQQFSLERNVAEIRMLLSGADPAFSPIPTASLSTAQKGVS
jgi:hypothetical protein